VEQQREISKLFLTCYSKCGSKYFPTLTVLCSNLDPEQHRIIDFRIFYLSVRLALSRAKRENYVLLMNIFALILQIA
jgi:hypothetical protein